MLVSNLMNMFSSGLQEKFCLEVVIDGKQCLLKKEDGRYYKYLLNKNGSSYLKTKISADNNIVEKIITNRIIVVNSSLTISMSKNVLAFEKLKTLIEFI